VLHARILKIMGVQRTIFPEQYVGREIANLLVSQHIFTYMEVSKDHSLVEISTPPFFIGKSLKELNITNNYKVRLSVNSENLANGRRPLQWLRCIYNHYGGFSASSDPSVDGPIKSGQAD